MPATAPAAVRRADPLADFRAVLPIFARFVDHRWLLLLPAILAALATSYFSVALSWTILLGWIILPAIASDRAFHALSLFGPTTFAAVVLFLKFGVGLSIVWGLNFSMKPETVFQCGCFSFTLVATLLIVIKIFGDWTGGDAFIRETLRKIEPELARVGGLLFGITLLTDAVRIATGAIDRSAATTKVIGFGEMGWWSWFELFQECMPVAIFLVPLLAKRLPRAGGALCYGLVALRSLAYLLGGSRSAALFPLIYLLLGYITFSPTPVKRLELKALVLALLLWPTIDFTDYLRNSKAFHGSQLTDFSARLKATVEAARTLREEDEERKAAGLMISGRAIMEFSDPLIYDNTPDPMPYAGFSDLRSLAYVFIPRYFYPDKPILLDGNEIVIGYTGFRQIGTSQTVSLMADLYRRGGTAAVFFGGLVSSLILFFYVTVALYVTRRIDKSFGMLMILLIIGVGFRHPLFHWTVLSLGSFYGYSIPKNLFLLAGLLALTRLFSQSESALRLSREQRERFSQRSLIH